MVQPIIFYDIPSKSKAKAWSPNTWKTRYCLNIKGLPYRTVWVEYPDIEPLCKKIGAGPTSHPRNGSILYTLPVIQDPNTGAVVADSTAITRYLDKTYPDHPTLIPPQLDALTAAFGQAFWGAFRPDYHFAPIIISSAYGVLREGSRPFFLRTREDTLSKKEEYERGGEKRVQHWTKTQEDVTKVAEWLQADGKEKLFFAGDEVGVTYADITVAGFFLWFRECCGEDSQEWADMMSWDGGRWKKLMEAMKKYEAVDVGEDLQL